MHKRIICFDVIESITFNPCVDFSGWEYEFSYDQYFFGFDSFTVFKSTQWKKWVCFEWYSNDWSWFFVIKYVYSEPYRPLINIDDYLLTDVNNIFFHNMFLTSFPRMNLDFVPFLGDVCLEHPLLLVSQEKRGGKYR